MTMKFSVFALAALAAATSTSSRYMVAAAASRKRKIMKKSGSTSGSYGATGTTNGDTIPIGDTCDFVVLLENVSDCCSINGSIATTTIISVRIYYRHQYLPDYK